MNNTQIENTMTELFQDGEAIIANFMTNGIGASLQRDLIQKKTALIQKIYQVKKDIKDKRLQQKTAEAVEVEVLMQQGVKKTPAQDEVAEKSRADRYELEKLEIDVDMMLLLIQNWTYHLRFNEIDFNKAGVEETLSQ